LRRRVREGGRTTGFVAVIGSAAPPKQEMKNLIKEKRNKKQKKDLVWLRKKKYGLISRAWL